MIKSFSFIVLTLFQFNQLKILRQPVYLFFKLNQQYFFTVLEKKKKHLGRNFASMHVLRNWVYQDGLNWKIKQFWSLLNK